MVMSAVLQILNACIIILYTYLFSPHPYYKKPLMLPHLTFGLSTPIPKLIVATMTGNFPCIQSA